MKRLLTLLSLLLAGCSLGLNPAQVAMPEKYIYAPEEPRSAELQSRWWLIFEDERLDSIVSYALEHNRDMQVAASRIVQAHYNIAATRSALLPSLGISLQAEGQRTPPLSEQGEFLLGQGVSWNTALIGALRHTTRQARPNNPQPDGPTEPCDSRSRTRWQRPISLSSSRNSCSGLLGAHYRYASRRSR